MDQQIIDPVDTALLEAELTPDRLLRVSNRAGNEIYVVDARTAPNVMREIGRLREIAFRAGGGGTGKDCDIDRFDLMEPPCRQLLVWDPEEKKILGGYRYITGRDIVLNPDGSPRIATAHMFDFSERFLKEYLPNTIELGRSFVRLEYQTTRAGNKAVYTMYPSYSRPCRDMILYFLHKHFPDREQLVTVKNPVISSFNRPEMEKLFCGADFLEDYRILNKAVRSHGFNIPPLVNAYMSLSPTMKVFGTAVNDEFGNVEETGIFIAFSEIFESKKKRHIESYRP